MTPRTLEVRLEQFEEPVGLLSSTEMNGLRFSYTEQYLDRSDRVPISLALPMRAEPFGDLETRAFFDNLLQENDQLKQVMEREGLTRTDLVGLLFYLGADCPGAISCAPPGDKPTKVPGDISSDYDLLQDGDLIEIVKRLADREPLPNQMRDPSPLAGVQQKIALTLLHGGRFGFPKSELRVPTTHILKVPRRGKGREAKLEVAAAQLGKAAALEVALPTHVLIGGLDTVLVPRFDRQVIDATVRRIHQEDFAQALGLPVSLKYERYGKDGRRFDVQAIARLLDMTATPATSKHEFLAATIFNMAIGNTDNHAKNHALLYDRGPLPRLAPLYDMLPVRLDPDVNHDFSFKVGNAERLEAVTAADIAAFFASFGLSPAAAGRLVSDTVVPMLGRIDRAAASLTALGLKDFDDLIGRETNRLADTLKVNISMRERDYYAPRAGGWAQPS